MQGAAVSSPPLGDLPPSLGYGETTGSPSLSLAGKIACITPAP
jgi:hypothetical protein